MRYSALIGLLSGLLLVYLVLKMNGDMAVFLDVPSLIIVFGWTFSVGVASFGWETFLQGLRAMLLVYQKEVPPWVGLHHVRVIHAMQRHLWLAAGLGVIVGLVQLLTNLDDPSTIGPSLALILMTIGYALFLSLFFCQPALTFFSEKFLSGKFRDAVSDQQSGQF